MNNLIHKTNYRPISSEGDIRDQIKDLDLYRVRNPTISFFSTKGSYSSNRQFLNHEYDLYEYGRIMDTEPLVARAFNKKKTLVFKQGYTIISKNPENLEYVKRRLEEISYISKVPFRKLIREVAQNLISFHNVYIVKVRNKKASTGKKRLHRGVKEVEPIAAWFNLAPETMQVRINEAGENKRYRQYIDGNKYREFAEENIVHNAYNRRTGYTMGVPPLEGVKEDILALRRIEESVETLIYKSLFPIIHVKVGTEKAPAKMLPNGVSEVTVATELLKNIEDNGGVVTSERIEVAAIGAESLALRVESYLEHFKKRVYAGLGMSGIDFGDGDTTGRATGEVLSASLADSVIDYQVELEDLITRHMFDELLLESGKYKHPYEISEEDRVHLELTHTSTDEMITKESHALNMMNSGLILHNEAREFAGRTPLDEEQMRETHPYRNQKYLDELEVEKSKVQGEEQANQQIRIIKATPKPAGTTSSGSGGAKKTQSTKGKPTSKAAKGTTTKKTASGNVKKKQSKASGAANTAKSKTKPKNQHTKDDVTSIITNAIKANERIDRVCLLTHRLLADYGMRKLTFELMDASTEIDPGLDKCLDVVISEMVDDLNTQELNSIKTKVIVDKTIDKLERYINNILTGKIL